MGKACRLVGDVKYKAVNVADVKHADVYQLLAYVSGARLRSGIVIYAKGAGEPAMHLIPMAIFFPRRVPQPTTYSAARRVSNPEHSDEVRLSDAPEDEA